MSSPSSQVLPKKDDNVIVDKSDSEEETDKKNEENGNGEGTEEVSNRFQPTFPIVQRPIASTPKRSFFITDILSEDKSSPARPCSAFRPLRVPNSLLNNSVSAAQHCLNFSSLKSHSQLDKVDDNKPFEDDEDIDDDDVDEEDDYDDDDKNSG